MVFRHTIATLPEMRLLHMSISLLRTLILYTAVMAAVRIMGKRQIGELNPSELVITILMSWSSPF